MSGLCGNFNGNSDDDCMDSDGFITSSIESFAGSWKTSVASKSCSSGVIPEPGCSNAAVIQACDVIGNFNGPFKQCAGITSIDHEAFKNDCVMDYCQGFV